MRINFLVNTVFKAEIFSFLKIYLQFSRFICSGRDGVGLLITSACGEHSMRRSSNPRSPEGAIFDVHVTSPNLFDPSQFGNSFVNTST